MGGKVTLVGAGPGDPGLLTVKGRAALDSAEVVVYDRLVSPAILSLIPETARKIDVGKSARRHAVPQAEINEILLREAGAGHNVVRLKGGDPFVFGRGGEELEILSSHGVEFEEIPGITSAVAVPAYAGIPATHRDYASSLHIVTAHARDNKPMDINYHALAQAGGTLVFLMGASALPEIVDGLLAAGMEPSTPAAVVENGTLPSQRRCAAPLEKLAEKAGSMGIHAPAVTVVGGVCALAENLDWFSGLPLRGMRVLVTRPEGRSGYLARRLRELGADAIEHPCIATVPLDPCPALDRAIERLHNYSWAAFTSPAGVETFWRRLTALGYDARKLAGVGLAAVGKGTAGALLSHGLAADLIPDTYDTAHLGAALASAAKGRVLLPRACQASKGLTEALSRAGVPFDDVGIYRTVPGPPLPPELREDLSAGLLPYTVFTSASTVRGFARALGDGAMPARTLGLCIGPQTAAEAERFGIPVRVAKEATVDALIHLAVQAYQGL